MLYKKLNKKP